MAVHDLRRLPFLLFVVGLSVVALNCLVFLHMPTTDGEDVGLDDTATPPNRQGPHEHSVVDDRRRNAGDAELLLSGRVDRSPAVSVPLSTSVARFLLAINRYGPNNQFYAFIEAVKIAGALNRTLVQAPFMEHYLDIRRRHALKGFDVTQTFDMNPSAVEALGVRMAGPEEFRAAMRDDHGRVHVDLYWHLHSRNEAYWNRTAKLLNVSFQVDRETFANHTSPLHGRFDAESLAGPWALGPGHASLPLVVIDTPFMASHDYRTMCRTLEHRGVRHRDAHLRIVRALAHAPGIVATARRVIETIVRRPYVAVHWRRPDTDDFSCGRSRICPGFIGHAEVVAVLRSALVAARLSPARTTLYLASNRADEVAVSVFKRAGFARVLTLKDTRADVEEGFYASLMEQELCMQADVFVGSQSSTWSERVLEMRTARRQAHTWTTAQIAEVTTRNAEGGLEGSDVGDDGDVACGYAYMGISSEPAAILTLRCQATAAVIADVVFASFGAPAGLCPSALVAHRACHYNGTVAHVLRMCAGRRECRIPVTNSPAVDGHFPFYDCPMGGFALAVTARCTNSTAPPQTAI